VNRLLLAANIIVFLVYWLSINNILVGSAFALDIEDKFVMIPTEIVQGQRLFTLFTSMFMHAGWLHLFGNMVFLYIFGDNVEDAFGHLSYLVFYIFCGLIASSSHILITLFAPTLNSLLGLQISSDLTMGVVGASGAISGVLGAYLVLYPKARILTLIVYVILPIPAIIFLGAWFMMQFIYGFFDQTGGVAYFAHIGGFIVGMILAWTVGRRRKKIRDARLRL
jgi:membrane associated rhomboid family serine protease